MTDPTPGIGHSFAMPFALRDGTAVTIRVMRPDDRDRLVAAFAKLDPSTIYTRFFSYRKEIPESALERIAAIDFVHLAGLVATIGAGSDETVIGGASYVGGVADDGKRFAEVAFTIEEDYQGQGLATQLFRALAAIARRHGIARFTADVLSGNAAMLKVFARTGLPMRRQLDGGAFHVELDLEPAAT
jgi:RimJ/RimL family protein N-acetyltransferase